jgi:nucleotide-binding universal stress UspA family protein
MNDTSMLALSRLLLPVKDFDQFCNTLPLVELAAKAMADTLEQVDLLHILGGSFLSNRLNNIDFRAGHILSSDLMQRLRDQHYEEFVSPLLAKVQDLLSENVRGLRAKVRVVDGDPVKKICGICKQENFSTLILARRKKEEENLFAGTVLNGVVNQYLDASVYIIGENGFPAGTKPAARIMVGIDGSSSSLRAAREAALVITRAGTDVEEVSLVNVRDPSCFFDDSGTSCRKASDEGYGYLKEAEELLVKEGVDESKIVTMLLFGRPGETLTSYAQSIRATMCYIGRRDRSRFAEVLLGSVSGDIINRCRQTTVVLVSR